MVRGADHSPELAIRAIAFASWFSDLIGTWVMPNRDSFYGINSSLKRLWDCFLGRTPFLMDNDFWVESWHLFRASCKYVFVVREYLGILLFFLFGKKSADRA